MTGTTPLARQRISGAESKLEAWLGKIRARDPFGTPLRADAEQAIEVCRADLETFAVTVYRSADHGSAVATEHE